MGLQLPPAMPDPARLCSRMGLGMCDYMEIGGPVCYLDLFWGSFWVDSSPIIMFV